MTSTEDQKWVRPSNTTTLDRAGGEGQAAMGGHKEAEKIYANEEVEETVQDFQCQPCEMRAPKTLWDPLLPSPSEVAQHNVTHRPYRRWCKVCVEAWGKEDPHRRGGEGIKEGIPEVGMDYDGFCDPEDEEEKEVKVLVMKDRTSGALWGTVCQKK